MKKKGKAKGQDNDSLEPFSLSLAFFFPLVCLFFFLDCRHLLDFSRSGFSVTRLWKRAVLLLIKDKQIRGSERDRAEKSSFLCFYFFFSCSLLLLLFFLFSVVVLYSRVFFFWLLLSVYRKVLNSNFVTPLFSPFFPFYSITSQLLRILLSPCFWIILAALFFFFRFSLIRVLVFLL